MSRSIGLAMPRWDLGNVGYIVGTPEEIYDSYTQLFLRCYPLTTDMTKEMSGKVSCIIDALNRGLKARYFVFKLDPYGIANEMGTQYGIQRSLILEAIFDWFVDYLIKREFIKENDDVELDEELHKSLAHRLSRYGVRVKDCEGYACKLACVIATILGTRQALMKGVKLDVVDLKPALYKHITEYLNQHFRR